MKITFWGGAGGVTGSKHLLEVDNKRILLDCGTWQGVSGVRERNRDFPFAPETIDRVVLSHAHIDHCGMLPLLVKRGFAGHVFATSATREVAQYMLRDMAGIEKQDAEYRQKKKIGSPEDREPLFTLDDIPLVMEKFIDVPYCRNNDGWVEVISGVKLKMYDAGHILGSAVSVLEIRDKDKTKTLAFTGDLGPPGMPLLHDPEVPTESIDVLLCESTYGSRQHESAIMAEDRLAEAIREVHDRGGKMIVPAFSLGRTQGIVYLLHKLTDEQKIPRFPIYVDSPLAVNLTDVYRQHRRDYDKETVRDFGDEKDGPLAFRNLKYIRSARESKELNRKKGSFMIISASGMMTAGRVVHHLRHSIDDKKNAVFITGYQAWGTTGRWILEGAKRVELYGNYYDVKAEVKLFNEFSAHADRNQLQDYMEGIKDLKKVFLVHGEPHQADDLKRQLVAAHADWEITRPDEGDSVEL